MYYLAASMMCLISSIITGWLGIDWLFINHGLHPIVAFPLSVSFGYVSIRTYFLFLFEMKETYLKELS